MNEDLPVDEDPKCAECRLAIEEGSVVAFGNHIWHVECFRCAKCSTLVDHDSNLLLLSNGKPICENCSYNCRVCEKKIDDLAIMTGDDSYHSECFRCRLCQRKIEDLVFAKTSQGIYCIACHNGRMSKNRKPKSSSRSTATLSKESKDKGLPSVPSSQRSTQSIQEITKPNTISATDPEPSIAKHDVQPPDHRQTVIPSQPDTAGKKAPISPPFDDFDFDLSLARSEDSSVSIPFFMDGAPSQAASATSREPAKKELPPQTADPRANTPPKVVQPVEERNTSVRERRRPHERELELPKSSDKLSMTDAMENIPSKELAKQPQSTPVPVDRMESDRLSLFPPKSADRLGSPLPQKTLSPTLPTNRSDGAVSQEKPGRSPSRVVEEDKIKDDSPISSLPMSASIKTNKPSTPTKSTQALPAVPPRSLDRPASGRAIQKRQNGEANNRTSQASISPLDASADKNIVAQSLLTPPRVSPAPSSQETSNQATKGPQKFALVDSTGSNPGPSVVAEEAPSTSYTDPVRRDVPTTPVVTHKRNLSGPISPSRFSGRHLASKSLESYPQYDTLLGSPVTTFENDLSKAFNLSPQALDPNLAQANSGQGLERSGTISRLANKMLKHRKSISGGALSPRPYGSARKHSLGDVSIDLVTLTNELNLKNGRIAELENSLRQINDSNMIASQLESRKSLLASLESQLVETGAEHQSYLHHRHRASDTNVPLGEWKANVVADLDSSLKKAKSELSIEIESLIRQRNDLKLENEGLAMQKAQRIQDIAILEKKHSHLAIMNENMLKQIQNGMEANKDTRSPNLLRPEGFTSRSPANSPSLRAVDVMGKAAPDSVSEVETAYATSSNAPHDLQVDDEDTFSEAALTHLSSDRAADLASPKKFNLVKKTKRAFRWGRTPSSTDVSLNNHVGMLPPPDRGMSSSRSSDKLSNGKSSGGMFKRTWQSQQNLSSHLDSRSGDSTHSVPSIFGNDLTLQSEVEGRLVPALVSSCIDAIEARALDYEGLYRKSGGAGEMKSLIEVFESANVDGESADLTSFDIPAITSVLKQYLRKLPVPLICFDAYEPFLGTAAIPDAAIRVRATKDVLRDLPQVHYQTLRTLFKHLLVVSRHHENNLMTTKNLAVVLGPSILWDYTGEKEISDMFDKNSCVQFCIEHADAL